MAKYRKGRVSRFLKLSGLTTKVGASYLGQKIKGAFVSDGPTCATPTASSRPWASSRAR